MRISFWPAPAHLVLACASAPHFDLRTGIAFLPAHAHLIYTCSCESHFGLRMRISHLLSGEGAKVRLGVSFIALFTRVGWGSGLYVRVMLYVTQLWVRACVLL